MRPGHVQAAAYFADAAQRAGVEVVVEMSQISAREDSKSHAGRDHWIAERVLDWSGDNQFRPRATAEDVRDGSKLAKSRGRSRFSFNNIFKKSRIRDRIGLTL